MKNPTSQLYTRVPMQEAPASIFAIVTERIHAARRARARRQVFAFGTLAVASIIAFIPAVQYLASQSIQSGFSNYLSLILSDSSIAFANWKEVLLSIVESMPVMGAIISVGLVLVFAYSIRRGARYMSYSLS